METTTNRLSSAKWSRNLNKDCQSEANRLRLLERQRQLIESKLQRRQQEHQNANIVSSSSSSRPATSIANLRSGVSRQTSSTELSIHYKGNDEIQLDHEENIIKDLRTNRAQTSIPGTRPIISSLDSLPLKMEKIGMNNNNNNDNSKDGINLNGQLPNSSKNIRDNRSLSKSEANLNSVVTNDNENRKLPSPNPLTTVLTDEELLKFVSEPISPDVTLQCTIIRDKKGLDRSFYPTYYMHLQDIVQNNNLNTKSADFEKTKVNNSNKIEGTATVWMSDSLESINSNEDTDAENEEQHKIATTNWDQLDNNRSSSNSTKKVFILSGRRRKKSKTYLIGNNAFDISRDRCIAKLKSNVLGTQFTAIRLHQTGIRYEITSITYDTNVLGFKGPRKMTIIIPKTDEKTNALCNLSLQEELKRNSRAIMLLKNKTPIWNEETQSYVLNFHGRVTQASVKNFQLVVQDLKKNGKTNDNEMRRSASSHQLNQRFGDANYEDEDDSNDEDEFNNVDYKRSNNSNKLVQQRNISKSGYLTASSSEDAKQIADTNELVSLQFGRVSNTHFSCDVSWPLSLLQAFAIALSSFDSKLACE